MSSSLKRLQQLLLPQEAQVTETAFEQLLTEEHNALVVLEQQLQTNQDAASRNALTRDIEQRTGFLAGIEQTREEYKKFLQDARHVMQELSTSNEAGQSNTTTTLKNNNKNKATLERDLTSLLQQLNQLAQYAKDASEMQRTIQERNAQLMQVQTAQQDVGVQMTNAHAQIRESALLSQMAQVSSCLRFLYDHGAAVYFAEIEHNNENNNNRKIAQNVPQALLQNAPLTQLFLQQREAALKEGIDQQTLYPILESKDVAAAFRSVQRSCGATQDPSSKRFILDTFNSLQFLRTQQDLEIQPTGRNVEMAGGNAVLGP